MWNSKLFKTGIGILLIFLIIYIGTQISFIFQPLVVAFEALFISFIISGILYYFTYPLVDWLENRKLLRAAAILIVFLLIIGLSTLLGFTIGPILQEEFAKFVINIPDSIRGARQLISDLEDNVIMANLLELEAFDLENILENITQTISRTITQIATSVATVIDFLTGIFMTIIIVPFLLYYMLKEKGNEIISGPVNRLAPQEYKATIISAMAEMNRLLSAYVQGLAVVCLCVGILAYIGFLIIGLEYALILSIFIMITNVVPFLGPFIGSIPAVIIGLLDSPLTMLMVIILIIIVQQIESMLISPQIMGRKLSLSPLAIIVIVLVSGRLGGLLGIILAIPTFTVLKIIINHIYEYYQLSITDQQNHPEK